MTVHVEGTFKLTGWEETTYEELGGDSKLTRARMDFDFSGGIEAAANSQSLMFYRADGTAVITGLQRMTGRVDGHSGSFVLQTDGTFDGSEARTGWLVISGSATDELPSLPAQAPPPPPPSPTPPFPPARHH